MSIKFYEIAIQRHLLLKKMQPRVSDEFRIKLNKHTQILSLVDLQFGFPFFANEMRLNFRQYLPLQFLTYYKKYLGLQNIRIRGGSRTDATSKVELFVMIVNGWKPLTIITKSFSLEVAAVLDPPLRIAVYSLFHEITSVTNFDKNVECEI